MSWGALSQSLTKSRILARLLDKGYLYSIHPAETAAGLTAGQITFGFPPFDVRRYGAKGDGATDDTAACQLAYTVCPAGGVVTWAPLTFKISAALSLTKPVQTQFRGATVTQSGAGDGFDFTTANQTSAAFSLVFEGGTLTGNAKAAGSIAINVANNNPFVYLRNIQVSGWDTGVKLADAYSSEIGDCKVAGNNVGIELQGACHASVVRNAFCDDNATAGLRLNYGGGFTQTHNLTVIGGAYQGSPVGIWIETCYEPTLVNLYFERNTSCDIAIGASSGGAYSRSCYNASVLTMQTASPVNTTAPKANIQVVESVGVRLQNLDFGAGASTASAHVAVDTYSDKVLVDYWHTSSATPWNFPAGADAHRVLLMNFGRLAIPYDANPSDANLGARAVTFQAALGAAALDANVWFGAGIGGRNTLVLEALQNGTDVMLRGLAGQGVIRFADSNGVEYMRCDLVNGLVTVLQPLDMPNLPSVAPGAGAKQLWYDTTDANTVKFVP